MENRNTVVDVFSRVFSRFSFRGKQLNLCEFKNNKLIKRKLVIGLATAGFLACSADTSLANPIYVFRQSDGTIRFTTQKPQGIRAKVFTAKSNGLRSSSPSFSYYSSSVPDFKISKNHKRYDLIIKGLAKKHAVDPALVKAVIHAESSFNPYAKSRAGAMGLMQLMPSTARWLGVQQPYAITENINGGAKYLSKLLSKYKGNIMHTLAAYNAGENAVRKYRGIPPYRETRNYVKKVMRLREQYRNLTS
jgi:soluble lytic murein transglycosylase-like protein